MIEAVFCTPKEGGSMNTDKLSPERMLRDKEHAVDTGEQLGNAVVCPVCRFEYVHVKTEFITTGKSRWSNRGTATTIPMYCEAGHHWSLIIDQYKGWCWMTITDVYSKEPVEGWGWEGLE